MTNELTNEWAAEESEQMVNDWLDVVRKVQEEADELLELSNELVELEVVEDSLSGIDDVRQEEVDVEFHLLVEVVQSLDDSDVGRWSSQVENLLLSQWEDGGDQVVDGVEGSLDQAWEELLDEWDQNLGEVESSLTEETQKSVGDQSGGVIDDRGNEWLDDVVNEESQSVSLTEETQKSIGDQSSSVVNDGGDEWLNDVVDEESQSISLTEETQKSIGDQSGGVIDDRGDEWLNDVVDEEINDEIGLDGDSTDQEDE